LKRILIPYRSQVKVKPYEAAARAAGLEPNARSVSEPITVDGCTGLMLMGGTDVDPALYKQTAATETDEPDRERDEVESRLIEQALAQDIPILAICRGMQLLNVFHGGTLIQHVSATDEHDLNVADKAKVAHEVAITPNTLLAEIAGTDRLEVNSRHHQAVDQIGEKLRVSARDPRDSLIEAVERPDKRFVVGVQWHPEDQVFADRKHLRLFTAFGKAC
jgi:putative glutamine amidotransferase